MEEERLREGLALVQELEALLDDIQEEQEQEGAGGFGASAGAGAGAGEEEGGGDLGDADERVAALVEQALRALQTATAENSLADSTGTTTTPSAAAAEGDVGSGTNETTRRRRLRFECLLAAAFCHDTIGDQGAALQCIDAAEALLQQQQHQGDGEDFSVEEREELLGMCDQLRSQVLSEDGVEEAVMAADDSSLLVTASGVARRGFVRALTQAFRRFDEDGDGVLNDAELRAFCRAVNGPDFSGPVEDGFRNFLRMQPSIQCSPADSCFPTLEGFIVLFVSQAYSADGSTEGEEETWKDLASMGFEPQDLERLEASEEEI